MQSSPILQSRFVRLTLNILLGLFAVNWVLAVVGIARDMQLPIGERWAGSALLALEGAIAILWVAIARGGRVALRFAAATILIAYGVELLGVRTGVPFGHYDYTGLLVPHLPGGVPLPITFAWLLSALGAVAIARRIVPNRPPVAVIAVSALLSTLLDACLEPTATQIKGYWLWREGGPYYDIPTVNFLGWFLAGCVINAVVVRIVWGDGRVPSRMDAVPALLYGATVAMFAVIALFRGFPLATAIGTVTLIAAAAPFIGDLRHAARGRWRSDDLSTRRTRADASAPSSRE